MRLFDGHTHLEAVEDLSGAIARAGESGVFSIITVGSDYESNERALEISGKYERNIVYAALGIHPWNLKASQLETTLRLIEKNMEKAVAVGEIGLDYWIKSARRDPSKRDLQKEVFGRLLDVGKNYKKPAIVHCRGDRGVARRAKPGGFGVVPLGFATDAPRGSAGSFTGSAVP